METILNQYRLGDLLIEDAVKIRYRGVSKDDRDVFLSLIKKNIASSEQFLVRFEPIAETLQKLDASGVADLLDYGEHEKQGTVVQEYVEGESLAVMLAESEGLPVDLVLDIAQQIGEALQALHQADLVHGGLSPDHILLSSEGTVRLLDAGLAQGLNLDELLASGRLEPRPYHAPELHDGEPLSPCADFYALGVILYQALTGETPSGPENIWPGNRQPGLPPELDALVAKCLNPDLTQRIQSAAELLNGIEEVRRGMQAGAQDTVLGMETSLVGHTMGPYQLVERLGQGGMATVYKAYEPSLDRHVAVKVLPHFMARDPQFMDRFRREAKAVAQLSHPNIVPIHSFGEQDGLPYIAMRYVEGETLKHARDGACTPEEAIRLLLPVLEALDYAHQEGIIHRDIKPSNVLMADGDWPLLADFGLAKMVKGSTQITATGVGVGTPAYMSPEQGQGTGVDQRTDIYSLGIMLYEMLTGDVPFRADTPMAVVIKHITAPLPMPREVNPAIPEPLERVILKATAKNPEGRYQSAQAFREALEAILQALEAGELEVVEGQKPVRERTDRSSFQWKPVYWLGVVGVLLLLVSGVFIGSGMWASPQATPTPTQEAVAVADNTSTPTLTSSPTEPPTSTPTSTIKPTSTSTLTPTAIPASWARIDSGGAFARARVNAVVVDPQDPGVLYAATHGAGIYKSIDGGVSWRPAHRGLGGAIVTGLEIVPENTQVLYASVEHAGVYRTTDGGQTWHPMNDGIDQDQYGFGLSHLAMDPQNSQHLYHTISGFFYETLDGGESWSRRQNLFGWFFEDIAVDPNSGDRVYAAIPSLFEGSQGEGMFETPGGVYVSEGRGEDIVQLREGLRWKLVAAVGETPTLYVVDDQGLYTSDDQGATWSYLGDAYCRTLVVDPRDENIIYCDQTSKNGGQTWGPWWGMHAQDLVLSTVEDTLFAGTLEGVYRSQNEGASWEPINNGLGNVQLDLHLAPQDPSTFYVQDFVQGGMPCNVFRSSDLGESWKKINTNCNLEIAPTDGTLYQYSSSEQGYYIYRSRDNGETWTTLRFPSVDNMYGIVDISAHPSKPDWLFAMTNHEADANLSDRIYLSTDAGETWELWTENIGSGYIYYSSDPEIMYMDSGVGGARWSNDGGKNWEECGNGWFSDFAIDPTNPDRVFVGETSEGVWFSDDHCKNWERRNEGLDNLRVNAIEIDPENPDLLYAGTDDGAYISYDGGMHWGPVNDGLLGATVIYSLEIDPSNPENVYAATPYGIFKLETK